MSHGAREVWITGVGIVSCLGDGPDAHWESSFTADLARTWRSIRGIWCTRRVRSTPIFDGHNDVLLRLYKSTSADPISDFLEGETAGHIDLKKAKAGSLAGGFFALYSPSSGKSRPAGGSIAGGQPSPTLPPVLSMDEARQSIVGELAILLKLERASKGAVVICRTVAEIKSAMARGALAVLVHIEGADAIDADLDFCTFSMLRVCGRWGRSGAGRIFSVTLIARNSVKQWL